MTAGCLPTLATLPVFWGLYRTLSNVAEQGLLLDGFYFIPSLAGPTSIAARMSGASPRVYDRVLPGEMIAPVKL